MRETPELQAETSQVAMNGIADLQQTLNRKEEALLLSAIAAKELELRLAESQEEAERLKKKLVAVSRASDFRVNEMISVKTPPPGPGEKLIPETEVARMKELWRANQKALEKEQDRLRSELVKTTAAFQRTNHQLEIQTRAHRAEVDRSLSRVATLEQQMSTASASAAGQAAIKGRETWIKLAATAAGTAILVLSVGLWLQFSQASPGKAVNNKPEPRPRPAATAVLASPPQAQSPSNSHPQFQKALSRLNESLSVVGSASPDQLLRAVRKANSKTDPGVCNIVWNNGQPALTFSGGSLSLESSLDRCASAVERYLKNQ